MKTFRIHFFRGDQIFTCIRHFASADEARRCFPHPVLSIVQINEAGAVVG